MKYQFKIENSNIVEVLFNDNGKEASRAELCKYVASTPYSKRIEKLNSDFIKWAKENNIELRIDKLPYWAKEAFEDNETSLVAIQNLEPESLLRRILEYHGIIGFASVIADTVLAIFNKN